MEVTDIESPFKGALEGPVVELLYPQLDKSRLLQNIATGGVMFFV